MTAALRFDPIRLPSECVALRKEVRAFLAEEIAAGTFDPHQPNREDNDAPEFSRRVGQRGWLGRRFGFHGGLLLALGEDKLIAFDRDLAELVHHRAGSRRDQPADDDVLFETVERVDLAVDRGLG